MMVLEVKGFVDDKESKSCPQNQKYYYSEGGTWSAISSSSFFGKVFSRGFPFFKTQAWLYAEHNQLLYLIGFLNKPKKSLT